MSGSIEVLGFVVDSTTPRRGSKAAWLAFNQKHSDKLEEPT
jgi:hypothetical protein